MIKNIQTKQIIKDKFYIHLEWEWCGIHKQHSGTIVNGETIPFKDSIPTYIIPLFGIDLEYFNGISLIVHGVHIQLFGLFLLISFNYYRKYESKI